MLRIIIFINDKEKASFIGNVLKNILFKVKCSYELSTYLSPGRIIEKIKENGTQYDIFLLDGSDPSSEIIAKELRWKNLYASILFISNKITDINQLLKYRPSALITDEDNPQNILNAFKNAYLEQKRMNNYFIIKNRDRITQIFYLDIDYFENSQRVVLLHNYKTKEIISFYAKFEDVYISLPKNMFYKCHQSFIINLARVQALKIVERKFILLSGEEIEISKRNLAEAIEVFENRNTQI